MNERLPRAADLDTHIRGLQAVEEALSPPSEVVLETVEISVWVRGRELRATVDNETVHRIVAILTGEL